MFCFPLVSLKFSNIQKKNLVLCFYFLKYVNNLKTEVKIMKQVFYVSIYLCTTHGYSTFQLQFSLQFLPQSPFSLYLLSALLFLFSLTTFPSTFSLFASIFLYNLFSLYFSPPSYSTFFVLSHPQSLYFKFGSLIWQRPKSNMVIGFYIDRSIPTTKGKDWSLRFDTTQKELGSM